jgi:hypothetical protein
LTKDKVFKVSVTNFIVNPLVVDGMKRKGKAGMDGKLLDRLCFYVSEHEGRPAGPEEEKAW